jgi:hypothetical protein
MAVLLIVSIITRNRARVCINVTYQSIIIRISRQNLKLLLLKWIIKNKIFLQKSRENCSRGINTVFL